jgi:hypothetical protein
VVLVAETVGVVLLAGVEDDDWEVEAAEAEVVCGRTIARFNPNERIRQTIPETHAEGARPPLVGGGGGGGGADEDEDENEEKPGIPAGIRFCMADGMVGGLPIDGFAAAIAASSKRSRKLQSPSLEK